MKRKYDGYSNDIFHLWFENQALKTQNRQYRVKMRKTQRLDHAVIDQDDDIHEGANAALENGELPMEREMKSDNKDDDPWNTVVHYSTKDMPMEWVICI